LSEPTYLNNRFHGAVIGPLLAKNLCPYDVSRNEKARYIFSIGSKDFEIYSWRHHSCWRPLFFEEGSLSKQ